VLLLEVTIGGAGGGGTREPSRLERLIG